ARFAPDGRTVAYSATWDGNPSDIYTARLESPDARPLNVPGAHLFSISATGEMAVALNAVLGAVPGMSPHGTLARLPLSGGALRGDNRGSILMVDAAGAKTVVSSGWEAISGLVWAPGASELWFVGSTQGGADTVWSVTLAGKQRALLRSPISCLLRDVASDGRV